MTRLVTLPLLLSAALAAFGADVMFRETTSVGAPATYGHLAFSVTRKALETRFENKAIELFRHYLYAANIGTGGTNDSAFEQHFRRCLLGGPTHHCHIVDIFHTGNVTMDHLDAMELHDLTLAVARITREMCRMIFGNTAGRMKRQIIGELILGFGEILNFAITLRNSHEISQFKDKMSSIEKRLEALIHANDDIVKTQVRDHAAIEHLLNSTLA